MPLSAISQINMINELYRYFERGARGQPPPPQGPNVH